METLIASVIAFAVTLFFVNSYVKRMQVSAPAPPAEPATRGPKTACPRCGHVLTGDAVFCAKCGAPLELWKIHRADVTEGSGADGAPQGKPRPVINASLCIGCGTCVDVCPESGALALAGGKAILAGPDKCVGHAKCVDVCPTSAIALAFGGALQTLKVPRVDQNFETNISSLFIVGELGGMGLIKTAINEGRLVIDGIARRMAPAENGAEPAPKSAAEDFDYAPKDPEPADVQRAIGSSDRPADVIVVGAGPAGLSAALTAKQQGLRYLAFDQDEVASTIKKYPRHKFLMAEPVSMPLYGNLYIADGTKEALVSVWENILANTGVDIRTQEPVTNVIRRNGLLEVQTPKGKYAGRHVVLAMGKRGSPRRLKVPGEELGKVSYRLIEAETYENDDILVVGGGDSAVEAALALSRGRRNRVTLSYRKDDFSRVRERNQSMLFAAEEKVELVIERSSEVLEVTGSAVSLRTRAGDKSLPNNYVFVLIGGESPEGFLRQVGVEIVEKSISV